MEFLVIFAAKYLIFLLGLVWAFSLLSIPRTKLKFYFIFIILAFVLALIGAKVLGLLYNNPRPFVVDGIRPLVEHGPDNGFPSGHTLFSMLFATTVFSFNRKLGVVLGIFALVVGLGRVLAHVHHPVDILASVLLTISVTYFAWILVKKYSQKI